MGDCLFCRIASGQADADVIAENERAIAFRDIQPKAPVHILVVSKEHHASLAETSDDDAAMLGELLRFSRVVAEKLGVARSGYKVVLNVGRGGGQLVDHLHLHVLGGWNDHPGNIEV